MDERESDVKKRRGSLMCCLRRERGEIRESFTFLFVVKLPFHALMTEICTRDSQESNSVPMNSKNFLSQSQRAFVTRRNSVRRS